MGRIVHALRRGLLLLVFLISTANSFAQTKFIGNYAGIPRPANPASAFDGSIMGVLLDGSGGFVFSVITGQILRVSASGDMSIVAGIKNTCGYNGDGIPATTAYFCNPEGIAMDAAGNLFVADFSNARVRKITPAGIISTVAGNGNNTGSLGDGGAATSAQVLPYRVAVDTAGNLFISDGIHRRVRKVDSNGIISTVAGNGTTGSGGDGGLATAAQLTLPTGITTDSSGNLFIADPTAGRVRKVATNGIISTVAGGGAAVGDGGLATSAILTSPQGVNVDIDGSLYISGGSQTIRKVNPDGIISTVAGNGTPGSLGDGGPATSAQLYFPLNVAKDEFGNLFIATSTCIRKVDTSGVVSTVAGNGTNGFGGDGGPAQSAQMSSPDRVAMDRAGNLYFSDVNNARIRKISPSGLVSTIAGNGTFGFSGDNGPGVSAMIGTAAGIAIDNAGNVFFADSTNHRIRRIDVNGVITTVAGTGTAGYNGDGGQATAKQLNSPNGVAVDSAGNLFIADSSNLRLRKVDVSGVISTIAGSFRPNSVIAANDGTVFTTEWVFNNRVTRFNTDGSSTTVVGISSSGSSFGDDVPASTARLNQPRDIAVDASGNLFIADGAGNRVRKVTPGGMITTVAGSGASGYLGDGGPATATQFNLLTGVTVDASGNVYIADQQNNWIHKADIGAVPSFSNATIFRADFDGDGKSDILWQHNDGRAALWLMNGSSLSSGAMLLGAGTGWTAKQTGDFNGDGKSDILWQNTDGSIAMWLMNGLNLASGAVLRGPGTGWTVKNIADFDGDGKSDILWQHTDGSIAMWLMNGINLTNENVLLSGGTGWGVKTIGDFNGDGKADIVWQHVDGTTSIWLMDGLNMIAGGELIGAGSGWSVKAIGDFNGDGKADIVWQHIDGSVAAWLMDGLNLTGGVGWLGAASGWSVQQVGDFNGDGKADIVWQHVDGSSSVWLMDGLNLSAGGGLLGPGTGWSGRTIADLNGDGKSDIIWQNANGSTAAWLMDGIGLSSGAALLGAGSGWAPVP